MSMASTMRTVPALAAYVDRILKGSARRICRSRSPPSSNWRSPQVGKARDITLSTTLLATADEVIE